MPLSPCAALGAPVAVLYTGFPVVAVCDITRARRSRLRQTNPNIIITIIMCSASEIFQCLHPYLRSDQPACRSANEVPFFKWIPPYRREIPA
jgi:hypothetical protein